MNQASKRVIAALIVHAMFGVGAASANDYPTMERVAFAMECMREHGGQTVDNLYSCSCVMDAVAQKISLDDFSEVQTYIQFKRMPGDKGGIFRDSERGEALEAELKAAKTEAEKRCFIARKAVTPTAVTTEAPPTPASE